MQPIRVVAAIVILLAALSFLSQPAHGAQCTSRTGYYVASLNGDIDPGASDFVSSSVSNAESACASHFILVLTTNGGDGASMESIVQSISTLGEEVTSTTLIAPQGAFAFSAGAYIAEASDKIYMVPGTAIGSATPIVSGIPIGQENTTLRKDISAFQQYMEALTGANGRNSTATGRMVTLGLSYKCETIANCQALRLHVVDGVLNATSLAGALALLSVPPSTPVNTPSIRSTVISILSNPNVSSLLFLLGVFMILADIYHPTLVLSFIGATTIALSLFGLGIFGASPFAVILMVIGSAFIFLEVKTQHGISAIAGVAIFIVGFLLVFQLPPTSPSTPSLPPVLFFSVPGITYGLIIALGVAVVIGSLYLRSVRDALRKRPKVNEPAMALGKEGTMQTDLVPGGKGVALVGSEQWSVTSDDELKVGDPIKVKEVRGLQLIVEKQS